MAAPPSSVPAPAVRQGRRVARGRRGRPAPARCGRRSSRRPATSPRTPASRARSWCEQVENAEGANGLNAATGEIDDLVKAGIIDPAKVTRAALQNAASIAAMVLTTECLVADKPEPPAAAPAVAGRGHGRHGRHDVRVQRGDCVPLWIPLLRKRERPAEAAGRSRAEDAFVASVRVAGCRAVRFPTAHGVRLDGAVARRLGAVHVATGGVSSRHGFRECAVARVAAVLAAPAGRVPARLRPDLGGRAEHLADGPGPRRRADRGQRGAGRRPARRVPRHRSARSTASSTSS